jgi:transposase-like protein
MKDRKAKRGVHVVHRHDKAAVRRWVEGNGQALLPMLELLEGAQASIGELMNEAAMGMVEQLLVLSAQELAGAKCRGRTGGAVLWHGSQQGRIQLAERQLNVQRPRLRNRGGREVRIPAYERLQADPHLGQRVRDIMVAGVSTRRYESVLPEVAGTVGVSKSAVSRRFVEASAAQLAALNERSFKGVELLAIYIDGIVVHGHHIIAAIGVDDTGTKQLLGLARLPKQEAKQSKAILSAAYQLAPKEGMAKLKQHAKWLRSEHADAAASLLEGMEETFTVNALGLPPSLTRCLCTTNAIENPNGIVRRTSRRVTRYRDADMALRWTATGFLEAEKSFRKIQGVKELWILQTALGRSPKQTHVDAQLRAA